MPRKLNFADGFESSTEPVQGNITADNLVCYPDDASYEAVVLNSPECGNIYRNSTTGKIRYYDEVAGVWKNQDTDAFVEIDAIKLEQDAQDLLIAQNTTDIGLVNARSNHDRNIYLISAGEASHPVLGDLVFASSAYLQLAGSPNAANEISPQTVSLADNEVAYIDINRGVTPATRIVMVTSIDTLVETNDTLVIARRTNDEIHVGVNSSIRLAVTESAPLTAGIAAGGSDTDKSLKLLSTGSISAVELPPTGVSETPFNTGAGEIAVSTLRNQTDTSHEVQSFTTLSAITLDTITFYIGRTAGGTLAAGADVKVLLYADDGSGNPNQGSLLGTSDTQLVPDTGTRDAVSFNFTGVNLSASTKYWAFPVPDTIAYNGATNDIRISRFSNTDVVSGGARRQRDGAGDYLTDSGELTITVSGTTSGSLGGEIELTNDQNIYVQMAGFLDDRNTIIPQTITLDDNESVAYVTLNRTSDVATNLSVTVSNIATVVPDNDILIIARRFNDKVYFGHVDIYKLCDGDSQDLSGTQSVSSGTGGNQNLFRNSRFQVARRGSTFTGLTGNPYTADGWQSTTDVTDLSVQGANVDYCIFSKGATSTTDGGIIHKIESIALRGKSAGDSITCKFKAGISNLSPDTTIFGLIRWFSAGGVDNFTTTNLVSEYVTPAELSTNINPIVDEVVNTITLTQPMIDNGIMVVIGGRDQTGSLFTMSLTEPHLYFGDDQTAAFETKGSTLAEEELECERFLFTGANLRGHGNAGIVVSGRYPVKMRAIPTITTYDLATKATGLGLHGSLPGIYAQTPATFTTSAAIVDDNSYFLRVTGYTGLTTGSVYVIGVEQNNARILIGSAEL